jgi:DNA-binding XRE family transcriptional regulator
MEQNPKSMDVSAVSADSPVKESPSSGRPGKKRAADRANRGSESHGGKSGSGSANKVGKSNKRANRVRETRIERMMSKAELARRAGISVLTIDRVEKGLECRMDTKRKILEALGLSLEDRVRVFGAEE